jgi:hypothetical protein
MLNRLSTQCRSQNQLFFGADRPSAAGRAHNRIARSAGVLIYFLSMSAIETAKEIARITVTSGLSKEIIDLLEKKGALLTDQVTTLETEKTDLKNKVSELETELARLRPQKGRLEKDTEKVLTLFFERGDLSPEDITQQLGMAKGMAEYHCDVLFEAEMIQWVGVAMVTDEGSSGPDYALQPKGRQYLVKNKLVGN